MRVIGVSGEPIGVLSFFDALKVAQDVGLDLVEVAPTAAPPVCRVMDYGKFKYEQSKKDHAAKAHQKGVHLKEVKLRLATGIHDLEFKIRNARAFLQEGNKVKISMMFRGREKAYQERGREHMTHIQQQLQDAGQPEFPPKMEGNCMALILVPKPTKT